MSRDGTSAVQTMARSMRQPNAGSITVLAYATSKADDLSTARRLSLARGMAIRSILMENGIASDQIYVRALGRPASGGPEDRVDLTAGRIGELGRPDHEVGKR